MLSHRFEDVIQICSDLLHKEDLSQIRIKEPFHKKLVKSQFHSPAEVYIVDLDLFDDITKKKKKEHLPTTVLQVWVLHTF